MANRSGFALGKRSPLIDRKALTFSQFLKTVPDHPLSLDNSPADIDFDMDMNDQVGDCVVAGFDHLRQLTTRLLTNSEKKLSYDEIIKLYQTQNPGFDINGSWRTNGPGSSFDSGMVIQTFLEYLQKHDYILGFARINHNDPEQIKAATYLGLGIVIGVNLQTAQQSQTVWEYQPSSEWGGHCVVWDGYDRDPVYYTCISWGTEIKMTWNFIRNQCDEAWFVILNEHVQHPDFRAGFDLQKFAKAFEDLTGRSFPVVFPSPSTEQADADLLAAGNAWKPSILSRFTRAGKLRTAFEAWKTAHGYK